MKYWFTRRFQQVTVWFSLDNITLLVNRQSPLWHPMLSAANAAHPQEAAGNRCGLNYAWGRSQTPPTASSPFGLAGSLLCHLLMLKDALIPDTQLHQTPRVLHVARASGWETHSECWYEYFHLSYGSSEENRTQKNNGWRKNVWCTSGNALYRQNSRTEQVCHLKKILKKKMDSYKSSVMWWQIWLQRSQNPLPMVSSLCNVWKAWQIQHPIKKTQIFLKPVCVTRLQPGELKKQENLSRLLERKAANFKL